MNKKRHHFVPVAYLKSFCDEDGTIGIYRKDDPGVLIRQKPDNTGFQKYYYSQPHPAGGFNHSALEDFFCQIEGHWPPLVERLCRRQNVNDSLETLLAFTGLQRVRVPASRDAFERMCSEMVMATMRRMDANGELPPKPDEYPGILDSIVVSIDPHQSIHAIPTALQGMGRVLDRMGFAAVHNQTDISFLTSDNPVVYFDPSVPEGALQPYVLRASDGPIELFFPLTPKLVLHGHSDAHYRFVREGLIHADLSDRNEVRRINRLVCRFGYECVYAQHRGHEALIRKYADQSPILKSEVIPGPGGDKVVHTQVFGKRQKKPKWKH